MELRVFAAAIVIVNIAAVSGALALDQNLPPYQVAPGISGQIKSVGSDTLKIEMTRWANGFKDLYPRVSIDIESKGSATAPPALLEGIAQFAPMSRPMTAEEIDAFKKKYGYQASGFRVAVDALAVYVNKDNPIECLTLPQLNRIFSSTYKVAGGGNIKTWGEVGLTGEWETKPISLYGRNSLSGTYEFFREIALNNGDYKDEVKQQSDSEGVVRGVTSDKSAIGYSGLGYKTNEVRTVPLASYDGGKCYDTSAEATFSGDYPIARYLYIYLNKKPNEQLDPLRTEFIKYILSKDGQKQTEMGGYYPITNVIREQDLKRLGISMLTN